MDLFNYLLCNYWRDKVKNWKTKKIKNKNKNWKNQTVKKKLIRIFKKTNWFGFSFKSLKSKNWTESNQN